jgi:hypothetical protein
MLKPILRFHHAKNDADFIGVAFGLMRTYEKVKCPSGTMAFVRGNFYGVAVQFSFDVGFYLGVFEPDFSDLPEYLRNNA